MVKIGPFEFLTIDDVETSGKRILLRADINSPIDAERGIILNDRRIRAITETLRDLRDAKVVLTSHQGRPGRDDFSSLAPHAEILQKYHDGPIKFVEDVIGPTTIEAIRELEDGEVLVLENVRFCSEEMLEKPPHELVNTYIVRRLAPHFDLFINDAFAAAHRSQPSLVGFAEILPTAAGRVMERELKALAQVLKRPSRPVVVALGGVKIEDRVPGVRKLLERRVADKVLVTGLVGLVFLKARGYRLGAETESMIMEEFVREAESILAKYGDQILTPVDVAWEEDGKRAESSVLELESPPPLLDVGERTIEAFSAELEKAGTVVALGPAGVYERGGFEKGTTRLLHAIADGKADTTLIGGGHLIAVVEGEKLADKFTYVSTGGGALLYVLSGRDMPVIEALRRAARRSYR